MNNRSKLTILSAAASTIMTAFLLVACGAPSGNPQDGKRWYMMHNCWSCHGKNGHEGRAPEISNLEMSYSAFVRKLRTTDAPIMPYFPESKLSDQDAADIFAFLKSVPEE